MALYVDKYRPKDLEKLDYHKKQASWLKGLVSIEHVLYKSFVT